MKICIVGGGNIGTALLCYIKHYHPEHTVNLYTRKPELFASEIKCEEWENNQTYAVVPNEISGDAGVAAKDADIVFVALPHFAVEKAFKDVAPFVSKKALIGVLPGGGGCEFFFHKYFTREQTLFGFQRVPFIARLKEYGKFVSITSVKPFSVVGTLSANRIDMACEKINGCGLNTQKASNFLEVALTPTNPILHTSRIYELFSQHNRNFVFANQCKFYVGWSELASTTMFAMDAELHTLLNKISKISGLSTSAIRPLSEHYESPTTTALSAKINSIAAFQEIYTPMTAVEGGYVADTNARMFTEDFPFGLALFRSYFDYFDISAPTMDKVLNWYANYMGVEWFIDGKLCGKDLLKTGIIQNYGYKNSAELIQLYTNND